MRTRLVSALVLALACTSLAVAQGMQPVTTVANFHVAFGKEEEFLDLVKKFDKPIFTDLMKQGAVLAWGVSTPVMHQAGGPTHSLWWSSPSMAEMDKVLAAFEKQEKKMLQENPEMFETMLEIVDLSGHSDHVFRDVQFGFSPTPPPPGAKPYTWIYTVKVKPGHGMDYVALWTKHTKPVLDKLVADGTVGAYGLSIQEIRSTDEFTHFTWFSVPSFEAYEKARGVYMASMTSDERQGVMKEFARIADADASRSFVLKEEIFHVAPPPSR